MRSASLKATAEKTSGGHIKETWEEGSLVQKNEGSSDSGFSFDKGRNLINKRRGGGKEGRMKGIVTLRLWQVSERSRGKIAGTRWGGGGFCSFREVRCIRGSGWRRRGSQGEQFYIFFYDASCRGDRILRGKKSSQIVSLSNKAENWEKGRFMGSGRCFFACPWRNTHPGGAERKRPRASAQREGARMREYKAAISANRGEAERKRNKKEKSNTTEEEKKSSLQ